MNIEELGIERKIDEFGRLVLPIDYRKELDIKQGDVLEVIYSEYESKITLKRYKGKKALVYSSEVDELGMIKINNLILKNMHLEKGCALQCFLDKKNNAIILEEANIEKSCIFTGSVEDLVYYRNLWVSRYAIKELATKFGYEIKEVHSGE